MLSQGIYSIVLLIFSNIFMTFAWYGHLKMREEFSWFASLPLIGVIAFSWAIAFFEYCLQVPLAVFTIFSMIAFKMELKWNHLAAFFCLILAVYFVFKK